MTTKIAASQAAVSFQSSKSSALSYYYSPNTKNSTDLGLDKSHIYSPHVLNKTMSKPSLSSKANNSSDHHDHLLYDDQPTGGDPEFSNHPFDDDIYDFSNANPSLRLESSSNHGTDSEEEDINFDYAYGYDYERVIKDRLKIVNQELNNDKEDTKRQPARIKFDSSVTAVQVQNDTESESQVNSPTPHEQNNRKSVRTTSDPESKKAKKSNAQNKGNVVKLPLNDTVGKDQDAFANKIKEASKRYDEAQQQQQQQQQQQSNDTRSNQRQNSKTVHIVANEDDAGQQDDSKSKKKPEKDRTKPEVVGSSGSDTKQSSFKPPASLDSSFEVPIDETESSNNKNGTNKDTQPSSSNNKQKENETSESGGEHLIEKDGKFTLISHAEYTAMEKKREEEEKKEKRSRQNSEKSGGKNKPFIPHPPTRPKTSTEKSNGRRTHLNNRNDPNTSKDSNSSNNNHSGSTKRVSRSADYSTRSKSYSPSTYQTPEYAQNYVSPYKVTEKVHKTTETADEKRKREREAEERKRTNEEAFNAWCDRKNKEKQEQRRKNDNSKNETKNSSFTSSENSKKISFEKWCELKKEEMEKDRERQKKIEEMSLRNQETADENSKAFKRWLRSKTEQKNVDAQQEKLEQKKWAARRRRSRKYQRLAQALEMAHAYGYI